MEPSKIFEEYEKGSQYKSSLGDRGMYEQNRVNERMYVGDQWYGANISSDRPLVRYNIIKRIGEYKNAMIGANPLSVNYSAEGVPNTLELQNRVLKIREEMQTQTQMPENVQQEELPTAEELNLITGAMSDYFRTTAERVQLDSLKEKASVNAYVSGTGVLYTYWDESIETGMYADESMQQPVKGDIACQVLDIENITFGDPNSDDLQNQPYILIAQRLPVERIKRMAKKYGVSQDGVDSIQEDTDDKFAGREDDKENKRAVLLTRFWKSYEKDGSVKIKAIMSTKATIIRQEWDTLLTRYPLSVFIWERRRNCAYGDSEVTYLVPNQIAINRMITASVWAVMMTGMPIMTVNTDAVDQPITNDPAQIVATTGDNEHPIGFVQPPSFGSQFQNMIADVVTNTLNQAGANDAALGNMRPDNTSAIVAVREAATMPLQTLQNRFYTFVEDTARIWADFWLHLYGKRCLKIEDDSGTWYLPFDASRYQSTVLTVKIDVGASTLWSEAQSVETLGNLLQAGIIDVQQYLERMPKGMIPNVNGLIRDLKERQAAQEQAAMEQENMQTDQSGLTGDPNIDLVSQLTPEEQETFKGLDAATQQKLIEQAMGKQIGGVENVSDQ